jgi:diguanylate cyclase (GGDEF)-like protein
VSRNRRLYLYTAVQILLGVGALVIATALLPVQPAIAIELPGFPAASPIAVGLAFWIALTLVGSALAAEQTAGAIVTFDLPFIAAATVLGGPVAGGWVAMVGSLERRELVGLFRTGPSGARQVPWYGILANHAMTTFPAVLGGVLLLAVRAVLGSAEATSGPAVNLAATLLVAVVIVTGSDILAIETLALRSDRSLTEALADLGRDHWLMMAAEAVMAWLMVEVFLGAGWWTPIVSVAALLAIWKSRPANDRLDPLTGLLNGDAFRARLARLLDSGRRRAVVLRLELEDLEPHNRRLGRRGGDQVLEEAGRRLRAALRPLDDAARLEAGVFAALLLLKDDDALRTAEAVARRIADRVNGDATVDGQTVQLRVTIGVAVEGLKRPRPKASDLLDAARWACRAAQATAAGVVVREAGSLALALVGGGEPNGTTPPGASVLVQRGERALADFATDPASLLDPCLPAVLRYLDEAKGGCRDRAPLIRRWQGNPVDAAGPRRYRWATLWDDDPDSPLKWVRRPGQERVLWHPAEAGDFGADPFAFTARLTLPPILAGSLAFLEETACNDPALHKEASELRDEALPRIEHDVALHAAADDTWADTFALWVLTREPLVLDLLDTLPIATAARFASRARIDGNRVLGTRNPFYEQPLDSATAHLAGALWTLGLHPELLPSLVGHLRGRQNPDGGWGDADQPSDVLTTLVVADVLMRLDPRFTLDLGAPERRASGEYGASASQMVAFLGHQQEAAGWWRALDPETPWLTAEVCRLLRAIERPFPERFRWPHLAAWQRDRKTGVPLFAFYEDLAKAAAGLGALGAAPVEVAFLDIIDFGKWNKDHGQAQGDKLIETLARSLRKIPDCLVVRDGGDEFLIVGRPGRSGALQGLLEDFLANWFADCEKARLQPAEVRIVLGGGSLGEALEIRERLGREVGRIRHDRPDAPGRGVLVVMPGSPVAVADGPNELASPAVAETATESQPSQLIPRIRNARRVWRCLLRARQRRRTHRCVGW